MTRGSKEIVMRVRKDKIHVVMGSYPSPLMSNREKKLVKQDGKS